MCALLSPHPACEGPVTAPCLPETARGLQARERMLHAALDQFGRHGFDGTTTRMIAAAAGMNLGAIPYYFGTKEELYVEAAGFLADAIQARQREPLLLLQAQRPLTPSAQPTEGTSPIARDALIEQVVAPMQDAVEGMVARICGREAADALPRAITFLAAHQVMSLRLSDALLMRRLGWDRLTPERIDQLLDIIAITLRAQFAALATPSP